MHGIIPTAPPAPAILRPPPPPPRGNYGLITRFPPPPSRETCGIISRPSPPPSRGIWEPAPPTRRQDNPTSIPVHVVKIIVADAIRRNESCPISCDDITQENAAVTSCGHVFTKTAIRTWFESPSSRNMCPVCKRVCTI
jgi:hypothetical protein